MLMRLRNWAVEADAAHLARMSAAQQAAALYGATLAAIKLRDYKDANSPVGAADRPRAQ
jgi:hypothetical protein